MKLLVCLLLTLGLVVSGGCATVGKKFDTTHTGDVVKGETTKVQARGWFGEPHTIESLNAPVGLVERWTYTHSHAVFGAGSQTEVLILDFGGDGLVVDHAFNRLQQ